MPTLIRWRETVRAPEVAKWQQRYRIDWSAIDGRNGGTQRAVWGTLMERFKCRAGEEDLGAVARVLDLAKAFEWVSTQFNFRRKILRVLYGPARGGCSLKGARVGVELLAFAHCCAGCTE